MNVDPNDPSTHLKQPPLFNAEGKLEPNITVLGEGVDVGDEVRAWRGSGRAVEPQILSAVRRCSGCSCAQVIVLQCLVLPHKHLSSDRKNEIIL